MPDISVKDQLKKIVELQKVDGEKYNLNIKLKEKPAALEQLKAEFESHKEELKVQEEKSKAIQVDRKEKELDLNSKEDKIAKANADLSQIKTNKEYTAKITEIEHIKADLSIIEEKILISFEESDSINAEIEKEKAKVTEEEERYLVKKKEVEDDVKVIEDRIKVLESQHEQAVPGIDNEYLSRYERILKHKNGLALVPVDSGSCGGCHMNITPQQVNTIKMNEQLVFCEMCARILYLEDDS